MSAPVVVGPAQVPDLRLWLLDQWRPGHTYWTAAGREHVRRTGHGTPEAYSVWERTALETGTLWWVNEDMVDVLLAAVPSMPDDVKVEDLPRPSSAGLVVFAKPWLGLDADRGTQTVTVNALLWSTARLPSGLALGISAYRRVDFADGLSNDDLSLAGALGSFNHARRDKVVPVPGDVDLSTGVLAQREGAGYGIMLPADDPAREALKPLVDSATGTAAIDPHNRTAFSLVGQSWLPLGRSDWPLDRTLTDPGPGPLDAVAAASFVEDRRVIASLWTLLAQHAVASTTLARPERAARRRGERAGIPAELSDVRVIRLRLPEGPQRDLSGDEGGEHRRQRVRCVVSAHFCWQPCGPGRSERRLITRGPYVRGPAGAPLHAPKVVRAWIR